MKARRTTTEDSEPRRGVHLGVYAWMLLVSWTVCVVGSFWWSLRQQRREVIEETRTAAEIFIVQDTLYRRWASGMGEASGGVGDSATPGSSRGFHPHEVGPPGILPHGLAGQPSMSPDVYEVLPGKEPVRSHLVSLKPIRPENTPDAWEAEGLKAFMKGTREVSRLEGSGPSGHLYFMRPLLTEKPCLRCHEAQGYKEGDIRGGISVSVPLAPFWAAGASRQAKTAVALGILWIIGLAGIGAGTVSLRRQFLQRKLAEDELELNFRTQGILNDLLRLSLQDLDLVTILQRVLEHVLAIPWLELTPKGAIFLSEGDALFLKARQGMPEALLTECATVKYNHCLCGRAASTGEIIFASHLDERHDTSYEGIMPHGHYCVPIKSAGDVKGVMCLYVKDGHEARPGEKELLEGIASVLAGIIQRKRAEEALRASEQSFRSFFEDNPAASYINDASGQVLECNQAFCDLFGFASTEQAVGTNLVDRYAKPEDRTNFIEELASKKRIALRETTYKRIDSSPVHVIETVTGVFDTEDKLKGVIGFLIDVTDRKFLEDQLRQAQKMEAIGQLAGGVAHDFNNILMAIKGASEILAQTITPNQPGHKEVMTVQKAADRAAILTRQLLGFSRKTVLDPVPLDPNGLVEGLLPMLKRLLPETIRVEFIADHDTGFINADKGQIEQVLMNLCVNARDAMPKGGTVTIKTESVLVDRAYIEAHPWAKPGRYSLLSVTDTGIGMKLETASKVFDPFFTTKPQGKGTGLGLSMAYGIVKQHGGMIGAYSELGIGTIFKIYLPMIERSATIADAKVTRAVTGGHETILVVEDDMEVRSVVVEVLMSLGYKVLTAADGAEGLNALRGSEQIDLVVSDIVMPKMGGKELRAATQRVNPSLRFLFTSGYTEEVIHHGFVLDKGVAFLSKPYGINVLARKVRELLDRKGEEG